MKPDLMSDYSQRPGKFAPYTVGEDVSDVCDDSHQSGRVMIDQHCDTLR